jgi:L,D-peptidoglycan transpeptidase YkuD (ErfK/YbiS/YcfS/YnhG family)
MAAMKTSIVSRIRVTTTRPRGHRGRLALGGGSLPCALGSRGLRLRKQEGDGATPIGHWLLRAVLFRRDRLAPPRTGLPVFGIVPADGWCDDPADCRYNRPVTLPCSARAEALWRDDHLYDIVVVLGHNDAPPVPGRGSAIFLHLAGPGYPPTAGCVAVSLAHMRTILEHCGPRTVMSIG